MIAGIQKLSLVDYPHHPAFVIFLGGCNLRCPFCHNKTVVEEQTSLYSQEEILSMLEARKGFIDAVVVTGGEPTIHKSFLLSLLKALRQTNLLIKLDTNGTNPALLQEILTNHLVDYVAMDIKNSFMRYPETVGCDISTTKILKSIEILETSSIPYEFRMTINKTMHTKEDILAVYNTLKKKDAFFLQPYHFNEHQIEPTNFGEFSEEELEELQDLTHISVRN